MSMNPSDRATIAFDGFGWPECGNWLRFFRRSISIAILAAVTSVFSQAAWAGLSSVTKSFSPSSIAVGGTSTLTITIKHSPPGNSDNITFIDTYPTGLNNAAIPSVNNTCGGTVTAVATGSSLSLSGVKLAGNQSCMVSVSVTSTVAGNYLNSTGIVTSDSGSIGPATATLTVVGAPPVTVAPSVFNAFESSTGSVTGVIKTKVASSAFGLDVVALKTGGTAIETAFTGDVKLELVDASAGGSCGAYALVRNLGTLTYAAADSGRKTLVGISEPNAWPNARIRMTYPATGAPTIVACSTDNFAIRPASFGSVVASDLTSTTAGATRVLANVVVTGGNVHKAGQPFQISATAHNAVGTTTANYVGTPTPSLVACVLPGSGCVLGTLVAGTWSAASGIATTTNATYSEVGAFSMKLVDATFAVVDSADGSTAIERNIESAVINVGRFVPDHFDLTPASIPVFKTFNDTACPTRSFTYVGQPFGYVTTPQATITARNAAGGQTVNYTGTLWKLDALGVAPFYAAVAGTLDGVPGVPVVNSTGSGTGTLALNAADTVSFARTTPVAPFNADISLSISIGDTTENAVAGNGIIDTLIPAGFSSMAFDSGNEIRFGRLVLSNAHGSEVLSLPVPAETQFWNGAGFIHNTADSCTQLAAVNVGLSNWQRNLNACETSVSLSGRFNAGRGNLKLSAPGANNTGSVDLTMNLAAAGAGNTCPVGTVTGANQTWLQGKGSGLAYDQNPVARGSFGLYRGNKPLIYIREMY
jgi:MSHA biogenesis protein MshQ